MSSIAIKGNITGTGVFTLEAPATNEDVTLALPQQSGTLISEGSPLLKSFRNKLINGGCQVSQYGAVALSHGVYKYGGCDRFTTVTAGFSAASGTIQQYLDQTELTTRRGHGLYLASSTGTGYVDIQQRIESVNAVALGGKTLTLSVKVYQSMGVPLNVVLYTFKPTAGVDNYNTLEVLQISPQTLVPSGTGFTQLSFTFSVSASDVLNGLGVALQVTGITSGVGHIVTGDWQLEENPAATALEVRDYSLEEHMCKRYFEKGKVSWTVYQLGGSGFGSPQPFTVSKRVAPTVSYDVTSTSNVTNPGLVTSVFDLAFSGTTTATGVSLWSANYRASAEI